MLRQVKANLTPAITPEEIFIERYDRMLRWAMQLSNYDRDLAEDLLHDLFIQFVLNGPDTSSVENLDGYLYISLRNLNVAQQRRSNRNRLVQLSIVEYDSADIGLRTVDFRDQLAAHDELRRVCLYACSRKESAKIASILILRFFHGYYPDEITQVAGSPRAAIDKWLKLARGEAKASLDGDSKLSFLVPQKETLGPAGNNRPDDLLEELRERIFGSRQGDHPALTALYGHDDVSPVECSQLAHIVSCSTCLDGVNEILGLDLLKDRQATETLSRDRNKSDKGGGSGGGSGTGGGGMTEPGLALLRRKVKDTFVHKPQELCVAVNGHTLGSHRITAARSELNLVVDRGDGIDFVEIYSEQKIRLLLHNIEKRPPTGPGERTAVVKLSDDRTLEVSLKFTSPSPLLQVTYQDPMFGFDAAYGQVSASELERHKAERHDEEIAGSSLPAAAGSGSGPANDRSKGIQLSLLGLESDDAPAAPGLWETIRSLGFWLRPSTIAVAVPCLLIAAIIFLGISREPDVIATAPELLRRATEAELALASRTDLVVHRTVNLEERDARSGEVRSNKRIEIWQSGERRSESKRLYDEGGRLLAGEFETQQETTLYVRAGTENRSDRATDRTTQTPAERDKVWKNVPSVVDFNRLVASANLRLGSDGDRYRLDYVGDDQSLAGIVKASLLVNRSDLRPVEQIITYREANDLTEYHFIESVFEQRAPNSVSPSVFEPDAELLVPEVAVVRQATRDAPLKSGTQETAVTGSNNNTAQPSAIATADLEVEVLRLLNSAGADLDDQTDVKRDSQGRLLVTGLVDTEAKKAEILKVLAPVRGNPAITIRIETFEEAVKRQKQTQSGTTEVTRIEVSDARIAVFDDVARHIGSSDDEAVRRFSAGVLNRSRAVMSTAGTLKKLAGRFSKDDLKSMTPEARGKWLGVIRGHAANAESESRRLRQDIGDLFGGTGGGAGNTGMDIVTDEALFSAANRLFAEATANDRAIRSAFTTSADGSSAAGVKNAGFIRQLMAVERLAASLQKVR